MTCFEWGGEGAQHDLTWNELNWIVLLSWLRIGLSWSDLVWFELRWSMLQVTWVALNGMNRSERGITWAEWNNIDLQCGDELSWSELGIKVIELNCRGSSLSCFVLESLWISLETVWTLSHMSALIRSPCHLRCTYQQTCQVNGLEKATTTNTTTTTATTTTTTSVISILISLVGSRSFLLARSLSIFLGLSSLVFLLWLIHSGLSFLVILCWSLCKRERKRISSEGKKR